MVKKVMCVDATRSALTVGKVYNVFYRTLDYYKVENDQHDLVYYSKSRFKLFECDQCTERKCNSCGLSKGRL